MLSLILATLIASAPSQESPPAVAKVRVSRPLRREVCDYIIFAGQIEPVQSVQFRPRVTGGLLKVNCRPGQMVKRGDVLFEIDPKDYQAGLDKAKAEVERAKASVARWMAERDWARQRLEKEEVRQDEFDRIAGEFQKAESALKEAQSARELALLQIEFTRVKALINGMILGPVVEAGMVVVADTTPLGKMISVDPMYVYIDVDQQTVLNVNRLKLARDPAGGAGIAGLLAQVGLTDQPDFPREGRVLFEGILIDPATGTATWRMSIPNRDRFLMPGQSARVRLAAGEPHKALLVAARAVSTDGGQKSLFVVTAQNVVQSRPVKLGDSYGGLWEVKQGLKADEWVVIDGVSSVKTGTTVIPDKVPMPDESSPGPKQGRP
jgi:membrane fusion protein, multidrug efflux system